MSVLKRTPDMADLSHNNGGLMDFKAARSAGIKSIYLKGTEGETMQDPLYITRRDACKAVGILVGPYHYARPNVDGKDAVLEANRLVKTTDPSAGELVPALDFEVDMKNQAEEEAWCKAFAQELARLLSARGLKVGKGVHYGPDDFGADYPMVRWVPRYNSTNEPPTVRYDWVQFSNGISGVPNFIKGLGHVDLTDTQGYDMSKVTLTKKTPDAPKDPSVTLNVMHSSQEFSDNDSQHTADANKIFAYALANDIAWVTGTEAGGGGSGNLSSALDKAARANGYRYNRAPKTDCWVAVQEKLISGGWTPIWQEIVPAKQNVHSAMGVSGVSFNTQKLGPITVLSGHYMTKGRPGTGPLSVNLDINKKFATAIGQYATKAGKGKGLVFYAGDQNILDRTEDTFFDQPLTSCWDELHKWDNTGHGNIDVIASYDGDVRVSCVSAHAMDDKEFSLNTDHYAVRASYLVRLA